MIVTVEIEKLITTIAHKLPCKKLVGYREHRELIVWNMQVRVFAVPVYETWERFQRHVRKMRLAWLSEGRVGLMRYVEQYIAKRSLEKIRTLILSIKKDKGETNVPRARFPMPPPAPKDRIIRNGLIAYEPPPKR